MLVSSRAAAFRPVASLSEKGEADKARARRFKKAVSEFAGQEKAYARAQYRWLARQHARAQSSLKKAVAEFKADWSDPPDGGDDSDLWGSYRDHVSDDFWDDDAE